ncbi:MAG: hypothetical protein WBO77_01270, partial [Microgenomates group bacterium]
MDPKKSGDVVFETIPEPQIPPAGGPPITEEIDLSAVDETPTPPTPVTQTTTITTETAEPATLAGPSPLSGAQPEPIDTTFDLEDPHEGSNKTKIFLIIGAVVFFIIMFFILFKVITSFTGGKSDSSSKEVTLTYWGLWEDKATIDPLIAEYKKKNPK